MDRIARAVSLWTGTTAATACAFGFVVAWIAGGLLRPGGFDDSYQLLLNSPTTALTFLMVFLIQRAQNADTRALHLKLDELVRAVEGARNEVAGIEQQGEQAIELAQKVAVEIAEENQAAAEPPRARA
jgi:low affinity Fe/Cu permease